MSKVSKRTPPPLPSPGVPGEGVRSLRLWLPLLVVLCLSAIGRGQVIIADNAAQRVAYGAQRLNDAINSAGITPAPRIVVGDIHQDSIRHLVDAAKITLKDGEPRKEGFVLASGPDRSIVIAGA